MLAQIVFPLGAVEWLPSLRPVMFPHLRVEREAFEHFQIYQIMMQLSHVVILVF